MIAFQSQPVTQVTQTGTRHSGHPFSVACPLSHDPIIITGSSIGPLVAIPVAEPGRTDEEAARALMKWPINKRC